MDSDDGFYRSNSRRRRLIVISSLAVVLLVVIVGAIIGTAVSRKGKGGDSEPSSGASAKLRGEGPISPVIKTVCSLTTYPEQCLSSLASVEGSNNITDPEKLLPISLVIALDGLSRIKEYPTKLAESTEFEDALIILVYGNKWKDPRAQGALNLCSEMIEESMELVNDSLALLKPEPGERMLTDSKVQDIRTYLSAALTNKETCLDGLLDLDNDLQGNMTLSLKNSTEFTSNCLAIATRILDIAEDLGIPFHRKLLHSTATMLPPEWVSRDTFRKRFLQGEASRGLTPDITVAADGSGEFTSINDALAAVPEKSETVFVVYVKAGTYRERVVVPKKKDNVFLFGDGAGKTIVTGKRSVNGGSSLYETASFVVEGKGCMVQGMTFENAAGPEGEQAVALVVKADHVVIYKCLIIGFQDSLYVHSFRQFYRNCDVVGTVDFIFGDAAVVFQDCFILPRQPGDGQKNLITAQGRSDPNSVTGISIHNCRIAPFDKVTAPTFLGRPWKEYSRTVFMKSEIDGFVDPAGWRSWDGSGNVPSTIFYGEYMNTGAGASTANRVKWSGYKPELSPAEADKYSVGSFIQGGSWIPNGVPYITTV